MTSFPWKNTLLVIAAALMAITSLLVTATLSLRLQERIILVQRVRDLRRQVSLVGAALREAEAAQRMFVITGDDAHHVLFAGVRASMASRWRGLNEAATALSGAMPDLEALREASNEALTSLESTAAMRRTDGREEAIKRVESGRSEQQLATIHMRLEALTEELERRTEEETRSLALAEARGRAASVGAGVVALGAGALGVWQWWRSFGHYRRQLELAAEKSRAEQMVRDKGEFLAAMSHEVRTPLNTILGMSDQLCSALPPGPLEEKAGAVRMAAQTMLRLVNDLLDLSRLEAGRLELAPSIVSPASELVWLRRLLGSQADTAGVSLELNSASNLPPFLWLDQGRFRQILINLTSNGLKFTQRGGRVRVRLEHSESQNGPELVIEVKDTGIGIARDLQTRIFQPYVQGARRNDGGADSGVGLGLAIVGQLTGLMEGVVSLQSRPGGGATFRVLLPLRVPPGDSVSRAFGVDRPAETAPLPAPAGAALPQPLPLDAAVALRKIVQDLYPVAAATHSTDDVKRLTEALAQLAVSCECPVLAEEAARLKAASTSFALTELSEALASLPERLAPLDPGS